jgi:hypothetical protein
VTIQARGTLMLPKQYLRLRYSNLMPPDLTTV